METLGTASEAQEFFTSVEDCFGSLRGRPLILSPRDVGIVKQWHEAGIPLRAVAKGLERFFERERKREKPRSRPPTLAWCERDVFEMWEEWKATQLGAEESATAAPIDHVRARLNAMVEPLGRAFAAAESGGHRRLVRALGRVLESLAQREQAPLQLDDVETHLAKEEALVVRAARRDLGESALAQLTRDVAQAVEPLRSGIDERAFEVLLRKAEERAVLQRFGIPRIAVFSF